MAKPFALFIRPFRMRQAGVSALAAALHRSTDAERVPAYSVHVDLIRAAAAFIVLACHARLLFFGEHRNFGPPAHGGKSLVAPGFGHHAVIVFFVLSGFLVGNSVWRAVRSGRWSWGKYLLQRLTRLWTVLLPALAAGGLLDHLGMRLLAHSRYLYSSPAGQPFLTSSLSAHSTLKVLAADALFLQFRAGNYGTNAALWSLANEFWYYLLFPLLLLAIADRSAWRRLGYLALTLLLLRFVGSGIAASFVEWLLGFLTSILPLALSRRFQGAAAALCLAQFLGINWLLKVHPFPQTAADLLLGFSFSLLLYVIAHRRQPVGSLAYQRTAARFAGFSYTLYLTHLPFLTFAVGLLIRPWRPWSKDPFHLVLAALVVCFTYAYSYTFYLVFERNTDRIRRFLSPLVLGTGTGQEQIAHQPQSAS